MTIETPKGQLLGTPQWSRQFCYGQKIPMAWGTTTDKVTTEINHFPYARETKHLTLKDIET